MQRGVADAVTMQVSLPPPSEFADSSCLSDAADEDSLLGGCIPGLAKWHAYIAKLVRLHMYPNVNIRQTRRNEAPASSSALVLRVLVSL